MVLGNSYRQRSRHAAGQRGGADSSKPLSWEKYINLLWRSFEKVVVTCGIDILVIFSDYNKSLNKSLMFKMLVLPFSNRKFVKVMAPPDFLQMGVHSEDVGWRDRSDLPAALLV